MIASNPFRNITSAGSSTMTDRVAELLGLLLVSPPYAALSMSVPIGKIEVEQLAIPALSAMAAQPLMPTPSSAKVLVPVGL